MISLININPAPVGILWHSITVPSIFSPSQLVPITAGLFHHLQIREGRAMYNFDPIAINHLLVRNKKKSLGSFNTTNSQET